MTGFIRSNDAQGLEGMIMNELTQGIDIEQNENELTAEEMWIIAVERSNTNHAEELMENWQNAEREGKCKEEEGRKFWASFGELKEYQKKYLSECMQKHAERSCKGATVSEIEEEGRKKLGTFESLNEGEKKEIIEHRRKYVGGKEEMHINYRIYFRMFCKKGGIDVEVKEATKKFLEELKKKDGVMEIVAQY